MDSMLFPTSLTLSRVSDPKSMIAITLAVAAIWGFILEVSKEKIYSALPSTGWWSRAVRPTTSMMYNFGYPKDPTPQFPKGVTEPMARDFYAFLTTICFQHGVSALPMLPVVIKGWDEAGEIWRCAFVLGTLSDVGFDIYDAVKSTLRTFTKHPAPLPLDFWMVIVAMHHTLALSLVIPLNLKYVHLPEYHQVCVSLLFAASIGYGVGCYKFALDIKRPKDFYTYKLVVVFQLAVILYTRVYMWFPRLFSIIGHFKSEGDTVFFWGGCFMALVFSVFNLLLVSDGVKAAIMWLPKKMPKTVEDAAEASKDGAALGMPTPGAVHDAVRRMRRRKFKAAVHSVIMSNRLQKIASRASEGKTQ